MRVEDYHSDSPPPRIIGSECEYDIQSIASNGSTIDLSKYIGDKTLKKAGLSSIYRYLSNGGALFEDVNHLEYASPECIGAEDATRADLAGALVVANVVNASRVKHRGIYRHSAEFLPKNELTEDEDINDVTHGYHENFMTTELVAHSSTLINTLLPAHVATRIYSWCGTVRSGFVLGQKVWGMGGDPVSFTRERVTKHGEKPMIVLPENNDRDFDKMSTGWRRVEIRSADPTLFPTAKYLGFATTSLVLRLVEQADKLDLELAEMCLRDPAVQARDVAKDLTLKKPVELINGKFVTAVDLQQRLLDAVRELSERIELPDDELKAMPLWQSALDDLKRSDLTKGELGSLPKYVSWAALYYSLVERGFGPDQLHNYNDEVMERVLTWDRILPTGSGALWQQKTDNKLFSKEEIDELVLNPPKGGRAAARAEVIRKNYRSLVSARWDMATKVGSGGDKTFLTMPDPYSERVIPRKSDLIANTVEI